MRPTFLGFETARKGIMASQKALDITGNNISNVNTTGYTRQRVDVFSMVTTGGGTRYSASKIGCAGQGVYAAGISQIRDPFLDKRYRELNSDTAESATKSSILTDIENVLDNIDTDGGLQNALLSFQKSLSSFATDAADRVEMANIASQSAQQLVNVVNSYDYKLNQIMDQTTFELDSSIGDVNSILNKIASLNKQIADTYVSNGDITSSASADYTVNAKYGPNELLDARNVLIDTLSQYGNIEVKNQNDGTVTINFAGADVVTGNTATQLSYRVDSTSGALVLSYTNGAEYKPTNGSLKGYVDLYNGNGCYATGAQTGIEGIPYYKSVINKFAEAFASSMNKMNVDTSAPNTPRPLFVSSDGGPITAGTLRISDSWLTNPMSLIPTNQDGSLDNTHINKLLSVFDTKQVFGDKQDFSGTFEGYISYYTNKLSQDITFQSGKKEASQTLTTSILNQRDATSGVSLDEEGINMMNFQKWFNASARIMTTLDESLDTIINKMGVVGR